MDYAGQIIFLLIGWLLGLLSLFLVLSIKKRRKASGKELEDVLKPDNRSVNLAVFDRETGASRPLALVDCREKLSRFQLKESVPEDIRGYFETVKNVHLYGWFVYPFYTVAIFLAYTAIEMALRVRFSDDDPQEEWSLHELLKEAWNRELFHEEEFKNTKALQEGYRAFITLEGLSPEQGNFRELTNNHIRFMRNYFAHPSMNTILMPGDAAPAFALAVDCINQLFSRNDSSSSSPAV